MSYSNISPIHSKTATTFLTCLPGDEYKNHNKQGYAEAIN